MSSASDPSSKVAPLALKIFNPDINPVQSVLRLTLDSSITIGRSTTNDISFLSPRVSRKHMRIFWDAETLQVEDLESTNGTVVNGVRVEREELKAGDQIDIGDIRITVHNKNDESIKHLPQLSSVEEFAVPIAGDNLLQAKLGVSDNRPSDDSGGFRSKREDGTRERAKTQVISAKSLQQPRHGKAILLAAVIITAIVVAIAIL